jgi:5-dehydro-2-deoxygluconokinase
MINTQPRNSSITYTWNGESYTGTIFPAKVLKTFGAGDSYASAFIYGLMEGLSIDQSMEFGAASAAIVISSHR